ncbi:BTAD domain-containing putative transcriptional regulator [Saccharopolyspora phatthalungensis]|uniref:DNA-binding SARP family transcriptional activator/DNA-binding CsgD family transcriptional regulator/tetratricopeptide (TPR) repeat protein n=1 Tax=Saccharopolyspora phatthalungensis TaxID=664693 RepID=A0A840PXJ0_9PSEU|nr:BTAD domain-containing putative transcriptional regulator [Saccharopolyspora phatthalungensis]MBB5152480.1 DNA-binding SARP family transcriptional activator/DNA-binding CsgD family transcriptional regulator/tetratricopeptide (TPR) repeat protein [Saccharopolyspora phatthalungensis]
MPASVSGPLQVELLGPARAWLGQDEIALGPPRQRALFAVLALHANHVVSRHELIDALWGESPPASAEGSVYTYVSGLRRCLEPERSPRSNDGVLISESTGYTLRLQPPEALDVSVFNRLREQGRQQLAAGDHQGAVESLDAALGLWRGEALSGIPGPFAQLHRERLAELRLATMEHRASAVLGMGGHVELVAELSGLVAEFPLRESLRAALMIALYRSGRPAEALETFRDARRVLVEDLGIEPGPELRGVHEQILANDPALDPTPAKPPKSSAGTAPLSIVPAHIARALHRSDEDRFVGRASEAARLRELVSEVLSGRGRPVWIEGEAGIGKSELLATTLADAGRRGCQLAWAVADELSQRFPLQVMTECLGVETKAPDTRRAQLAAALHGERSTESVNLLLELVDELCAISPLILVIDDLQWADEASVLVWHRLCAATRQLPLLLVAATRPAPDRVEVGQLRRAVESRDGEVFHLGPLTDHETEELLGEMVGAKPGPVLREIAGRAAGNPLYVQEMTDALIRADAVEIADGTADVPASSVSDAPRSLLAAVGRRLDLLSASTREVIRWGALLGLEFSVADVAAATGRQAFELLEAFEEAVVANVLVDAESELAFRHPLLRQALYDGIPKAVRGALHRQVAEALARGGAPVKQVAEQLLAAPNADDRWVLEWLAENNAAVSNRAPLIAIDLFERALESCPIGDPNRELLLVALVKVLFRAGRDPLQQARQALVLATDPHRSAEMRQLLAAMLHRRGETPAAIDTLGDAADNPTVPEIWRARHRSLLANFRRGNLSDLEATEKSADEAYEEAVATGDRYPIAHAVQTMWLVDTVRRDHARALKHIDKALDVVGADADLSEFRFDLLDNRAFTLQNLDRLTEAEETMHTAREVAAQHLSSSGLQVTEAVHYYWVGRWDEAVLELQTSTEDGPAISFYGLREPGPATLLSHGVSALIAGRRDDGKTAARHLDAAEEYSPSTGAERESCDFLLVAQALAAEQRGEPDKSLSILDPVLNPGFAPLMLRHQWLPDLVRLAVEIGDLDRANQALEVCQEEAAKESRPGRAFTAVARCQGLISGDPEPIMVAVEHYREVGRVVELAAALEDAALLLAQRNLREDAQCALDEAVLHFAELSAHWDIRRAESRLRSFDIRPSAQTSLVRPAEGWEALSPEEVRIATLVAEGRSNPDIAAELAVPRRIVQGHVARVLAKLNAHSRVAIVDEVRSHVAVGS